MIRKLVGIYTLMRSVTFVLVTDTRSMMSFPKRVSNSKKNDFLLMAQQAAIQYLIDGLEEMKEEHKKAIKNLHKRK